MVQQLRAARSVLGAILLLLCGVGSSAPAATLNVEVGWGGAYRPGRWTPIFITAADARPRAVQMEVYVPHDDIQAMVIHQTVTISPTPTTIALYLPLGPRAEELSVTLRDPNSIRKVAEWINTPGFTPGPVAAQSQYVDQLVGVSGYGSVHRLLESQLRDTQRVSASSIDPLRLPSAARGYDALNVLVLNQPDLSRISREQQQAIVDWVRAGGFLVCWMGEQQPAPASPVLDALPVEIGENVAVNIPPTAVQSAGLPDRFADLKGRSLTPRRGAEPLPLFDGAVSAYRHRFGLGHIVVLPIDASSLLFRDGSKARDFWRPLLQGGIEYRSDQGDSGGPAYYYNPYTDAAAQRRSLAASNVMDRLGDVPGVGQFGISYVVLVMLGMMVVVGPVDWIVLKKLGRQPWTWMTTTGWIALVTLGAIFIGQLFKSGQLHFRTLRLTDQIGNVSVASIDTIGIYSPRTAWYGLKVNPESWWEPLAANANYYTSAARNDIPFHQDYRGNRPDVQSINVWNLRFLVSESLAAAAPTIAANLRVQTTDGKRFLVGTITNTGASPLTSLRARTAESECEIGGPPLPPQSVREIRAELIQRPKRPSPVGGNFEGHPRETVAVDIPFGLAAERSAEIDRILASSDSHVCIYAEIESTPGIASVEPLPEVEQHRELIRALLPLSGAPQ